MAEHTADFLYDVKGLQGNKWLFRSTILAVEGSYIDDDGNVRLSLRGGFKKTLTKQEMGELQFLTRMKDDGSERTEPRPLKVNINGYDHQSGDTTEKTPLIRLKEEKRINHQSNTETMDKPNDLVATTAEYGIQGSYNASKVNDILERQLEDIYEGKEKNFDKVRALNDTATKIIDNGRLVLEAQKLRSQLQLKAEKAK